MCQKFIKEDYKPWPLQRIFYSTFLHISPLNAQYNEIFYESQYEKVLSFNVSYLDTICCENTMVGYNLW